MIYNFCNSLQTSAIMDKKLQNLHRLKHLDFVQINFAISKWMKFEFLSQQNPHRLQPQSKIGKIVFINL